MRNNIDIKEVLSKYQQSYKGKDFLFFPAETPKKLVITFNGATRDRYSMWSFFYNSTTRKDTSYLFLKEGDDPNYFWWYLKDEALYTEIISNIISEFNFDCKSVIMIGSSMGGYASIFYGLKFGVKGCISFRPQIDYSTASQFFTIGRLNKLWVDLDELVNAQDVSNLPLMYVNYSDFSHDKIAAYHWIDELKKLKTMSIIHPVDGVEHVSWNPDSFFVETLVNYLFSVKKTW